jgi:Ca2+-binding RTX toxin-like protein
MTTYIWSQLSSSVSSYPFDSATDLLHFDKPASNADPTTFFNAASLRFSFEPRGAPYTVFTDLAFKSIKFDTEFKSLTTANLTFAGGGLFLVGDNTTGIANDDSANIIIGGNGNDQLIGLGGDDTLTGGAGNDLFAYGASYDGLYWTLLGSGVDTITDFAAGDVIRVYGTSFKGQAFSSSVIVGDGSTLAQFRVELSVSGGVSTLMFGINPTPGADLSIRLNGIYSASQFQNSSGDGSSSNEIGNLNVYQVPADTPSPAPDFGADGKNDILWRHNDGSLMIWQMGGTQIALNDGLGVAPASYTLVDAHGDYNGDGRSDILWRNSDGSLVVWQMNGAQITAKASLGGLPFSYSVVDASGDYNGDGKSDILWRNSDGAPLIWLMNGTQIQASGSPGALPLSYSIVGAHGDYNGDGKSDIVLRGSDGEAKVWLMNGTQVQASGSLGIFSTSSTIAETRGDYNRDGKSDILWRNSDGTLTIWLMNGTQIMASGSPGAIPASSVILDGHGDSTGDVKSDILYRNSDGSLVIWHMNGTQRLATGTINGVSMSYSILDAYGDYGGDGKSDILWRHSDGSLALWEMYGSEVLSSASLGVVSPLWSITTESGARLSGDSADDTLGGTVARDTFSGGYGNDILTGGAGKDQFLFDTVLNAASNVDVITDFTSGEDRLVLSEVIFAAPAQGRLTAVNFASNANGTPIDGDDYILYNTTTGVVSYDADGSGATAAIPFAILTNHPLLVAEDIQIGALERRGAARSDASGDGMSDILFFNSGDGRPSLWLMNGATITGSAVLPEVPGWTIVDSNGDYNGDHKSDILLRNNVDGRVTVWQMDGTVITVGQVLSDVPGMDWRIVDGHGDYNGDGKSDLLLRNMNDGRVTVWQMNGPQVVAGGVMSDVPAPIWGVVSGHGDYDGDGKSDILLRNAEDGRVTVWLMNGTQVGSGAVLSEAPGANWGIVDAQGDYDGNGRSDILLRDSTSGNFKIWEMNGTQIGSSATLFDVAGTDWLVVDGHGDYNGDRKSDILLRNTVDGRVTVWQMDGTMIALGQVLSDVPGMDWRIVDGHGDYNGDGKSDILLRNVLDGRVTVWQMNGTQIGVGTVVSDVPETNWSMTTELGATQAGDSANNTLWGTDGRDTLIGRGGNDQLSGGSSGDNFVYQVLSDYGTTGDIITDFAKGANGDLLHLSEVLSTFAGITPTTHANAFNGGYLNFLPVGAHTVVQVDSDGGANSFLTLVTLNNVLLTQADTANYVL